MPSARDAGKRALVARWSGRHAVAVLPGRIDATNVDAVRDELLTIINQGATVLILDMTAASSCDRVVADALMRVYQRSVVYGTELRLAALAPAVRRVIRLSGLEELIAVFPTLDAATAEQPSAALTRLITGIFEAGLTLQAALNRPKAGLREAVERALDQLEGTARDARTVALARNKGPATNGRSRTHPRRESLMITRDRTASAHELLALEAKRTRARSVEIQARTIQTAALSAITEDRVAANLSQLAAHHERHTDQLQAMSQAATAHAIRIRQWSDDHQAAG